jgi:hypothetical protein
VTIEPGEDYLGVVEGRPLPPGVEEQIEYGVGPGVKDHVERRVLSFLAGGAAERKYRNIKDRTLGDEGDVKAAVFLLDKICGSNEEVEAYLHLLWIRTITCIDRNWEEIKEAANQLSVNKVLGSKKVREIIKQVRWSTV